VDIKGFDFGYIKDIKKPNKCKLSFQSLDLYKSKCLVFPPTVLKGVLRVCFGRQKVNANIFPFDSTGRKIPVLLRQSQKKENQQLHIDTQPITDSPVFPLLIYKTKADSWYRFKIMYENSQLVS
jgi:hypothetical protein